MHGPVVHPRRREADSTWSHLNRLTRPEAVQRTGRALTF